MSLEFGFDIAPQIKNALAHIRRALLNIPVILDPFVPYAATAQPIHIYVIQRLWLEAARIDDGNSRCRLVFGGGFEPLFIVLRKGIRRQQQYCLFAGIGEPFRVSSCFRIGAKIAF